ncbi:DUF2270 domain-containing protein [Methanonatronarchaeum sp. AMET-Sl]|uniref:DUF2270 domain-containing protein n=1 Tax=Methanonatronarchaeum sp. AMET-Sl TaxID=3037654 RepID=UPI00244E1ADF|nr:DUF2270 domain-containing protein [Methanonatronarchaeum sp. AMET-Sl]WGI17174.1 DUF2270 domain-containing protein [Methanonatronarchaeum sp. AMET-Sl]
MDWEKLDSLDTNVIMHVYRGELQRTNSWRQRMDKTTNWAIVITSGIITFALANPNVPHWAVLAGLFLIYIMLFTEARRYRNFDKWRGRVRALEETFLSKFFDRENDIDERWTKALSEDFRFPHYKITWQEAMKRRLKRIYIWLIMVFIGAWIGKVYIHPEHATTWNEFFQRIAGPLEPLAGVFIFGIVLGSVIGSTLYFFITSSEREAKGRPREREINEKFASKDHLETFGQQEKDKKSSEKKSN